MPHRILHIQASPRMESYLSRLAKAFLDAYVAAHPQTGLETLNVFLADLPPFGHHVDIARLSEVCSEQLRDILGAVIARDVDRARAVAARDDRVNRIYHRVVDELIQLMTEDGDLVYRGTRLIMAGQNFERIGDRVTNLAEDLLYRETGEIVDLG